MLIIEYYGVSLSHLPHRNIHIKKNLFDVIRCFHKTNDEGG